MTIPSLVYCNFPGAAWLLFGPNVPNIIYYSHIPNMLVALFLGTFIFRKDKSLASRILIGMMAAYEIWVFFALAFWATNRSDMIMFTWLMDIVVEPLVYIFAFYLLHTLIEKRDMSFWKKAVCAALYLPIPLFLATNFMLQGFDVGTCLAIEGPMAKYYTYFVEIVMTLWIVGYSFVHYLRTKERAARKEMLPIIVGILLLLVSFGWGNIVGSFTSDWKLGDYGLFGMPIFLAFLVYSIVKFKTFNIKLLGAEALVWSLVVLVGSQFFYLENQTVGVKILTAITLVVSSALGLFLVDGIKKETALLEQLETANTGQKTLIHVMNHQIKGYLGNNKDIFAELLTGEYGAVALGMKPMLEKGLQESDEGIEYVMQILEGASADQGTLIYDMHEADFRAILEKAFAEKKDKAEKKGLAVSLDIEKGEYPILGDAVQLGEAVKNLIDNSINYTPKGSIEVKLGRRYDKILLVVRDTGIGVRPEDVGRLFKAGGITRDSIKYNIKSSGYGLVFLKGVVEAHKGRVWLESDGEGKGTAFFVELPIRAE